MNKAVPQGWVVKSIGELVKLHYGKSPKNIVIKDGLYPVIGTGGVTGYASSYLYDGCTTVIGRKGTINKPSYVEGKFWAIDTTYFGTCYKNAEPKWFYYSLNSFDLSKYNEASGVPSLGRDTLNAIPILVPPIIEQHKIATILSSVDEVIEKTRTQIGKLKDLKTGMMQELLTKGIGHTEFQDSSLGLIPTIWQIMPLKNLVKDNKKITYGIVQAGKHCEDGVPYIRVSDMTKRSLTIDGMLKTSNEIAQKYQRSMVSAGDIVYALRGMIGHVHIVPPELDGANLTQGTARIAPNSSINSKYLFWAMQSPYAQRQNEDEAKGSTFKEITLASLQNIQIAVPSIKEQRQLSEILDSFDKNLMVHEDRLKHFEILKKALMQDLLTGKVRVNIETHQEEKMAV